MMSHQSQLGRISGIKYLQRDSQHLRFSGNLIQRFTESQKNTFFQTGKILNGFVEPSYILKNFKLFKLKLRTNSVSKFLQI